MPRSTARARKASSKHSKKVAASAPTDTAARVDIPVKDGEGIDHATARLLTGPHFTNATVAQAFAMGTIKSNMDLRLNDVVMVMKEQADAVNLNDLKAVEAVLSSQAIALNAMFGELVRRSGANMGVHLPAAEAYMKMALKAQNQCRMTLETLSTIKNPPVVYAKQANINHGGQQQVNNGEAATRVANPESPPSKLLEQSHEQRLDTPAQGETVEGNSELETVGDGDRT